MSKTTPVISQPTTSHVNLLHHDHVAFHNRTDGISTGEIEKESHRKVKIAPTIHGNDLQIAHSIEEGVYFDNRVREIKDYFRQINKKSVVIFRHSPTLHSQDPDLQQVDFEFMRTLNEYISFGCGKNEVEVWNNVLPSNFALLSPDNRHVSFLGAFFQLFDLQRRIMLKFGKAFTLANATFDYMASQPIFYRQPMNVSNISRAPMPVEFPSNSIETSDDMLTTPKFLFIGDANLRAYVKSSPLVFHPSLRIKVICFPLFVLRKHSLHNALEAIRQKLQLDFSDLIAVIIQSGLPNMSLLRRANRVLAIAPKKPKQL